MNIFERFGLAADLVAVINEITSFKNKNCDEFQEIIELGKTLIDKVKNVMPNAAQSLENIKHVFSK